MRRFCFPMLIVSALASAPSTRAADIEIPPPVKSRELSVHVNQPNCSRWTDDCVNCTRGANGEAPSCSNIGFACQPKAIRCTAVEVPQSEPQTK